MSRCPRCNSRKYRGNAFSKLCENCGFSWKDPRYRKTTFTNNSHLGAVGSTDIVINSVGNASNRQSELFSMGNIITVDYHNIAYKYPIIRDNPNVHLPKIVKMKGWKKEQDKNNNVTIQRNKKSVVFYLRRRIKKEISQSDTAVVEAEAVIKQEALAFSEKYNIELGEPEPLAKEVKVEPAFLPAGTLFKGEIAKSVYEGEVEFTDKDKAMLHAQNFVENMALLNRVPDIEHKMDTAINILTLQTKNNEIFAKGMEQHMILIGELQNTSKTLQEGFELVRKNTQPLYVKVYNYIKKILGDKR